tara:strand:+ start:1463 stop:2083 length:621 start_codon:yes stop_codon:yes gene_type:complete
MKFTTSAIFSLALLIYGCDSSSEKVTQAVQPPGQCAKDTDCKGDRICESGQCINPAASPASEGSGDSAPRAPDVAYEAVLVSDGSAGPFFIESMEMGTALYYPSRAGMNNLMESVVEDPELTGYVKIEKVYSFGPSSYVVVASTGEYGQMCPATTYAISFDTRQEAVVGATRIDGCSETLQAFAEGNKLSIKKESETTVIYNGLVQ